jgi:hypothetical protein
MVITEVDINKSMYVNRLEKTTTRPRRRATSFLQPLLAILNFISASHTHSHGLEHTTFATKYQIRFSPRVLSIMEVAALRQPLPIIEIVIPQERCYIFVQVTGFSHLPDTLLPSSVISSAPVNRKKPEITLFYTAHAIAEHESNFSKLFNSLQMMLRCHRQPPLPEHFYTPSHQKNRCTIAGILEFECLIQIRMVKIPISKHSNWFGGLLKTVDILIVVASR